MKTKKLGTCGLEVSVLSLGTMTFGETATVMKGLTASDDEARRIFDRAVDHGVNLIDTANIYNEGRSEELVGKFSRGKRDDLVIATKCRFPIGFGMTKKPGVHDMGLSRKHIVAACEASLKRLATDYVDLYQVHMQDASVRIDETVRALDDLVTAGKVRYVGCSNYTGYRLVQALWAADELRKNRFESVQLQWSLLERGAEREVVPACREYGIGVLAWSPLASGFLSGKYRRGEAAPQGSRLSEWKDTMRRLGVERSYDVLDALGAIAKEHGTTSAAVALAWVLGKEETTSVILGARTAAQLTDNLKALEVELTPAQTKTLDDVSKPEWGYPYAFIGQSQRW